MKIFRKIESREGKPNFGLRQMFSLPKNVNSGKPKFSVYRSVYRSVYPETPINKG